MINFNDPEQTESYQKNLDESVAKYVHTENPIYTAWAHLKAGKSLGETLFTNSVVACVYEENAGIHMIRIDMELKPEGFACFIPFEDIYHVFVPSPDEPFRDTKIKTSRHGKYIFNIKENLLYRIDSPICSRREPEFMEKLREFAKTLK